MIHSPGVKLLEELTFEELDALPRQKTIFILSVSPLEEHGPHLPLGVDFFTAKFFAEALAEAIVQRWGDVQVVLLPALAVGSGCIPAPGTITISQRVVRQLVMDTLFSLARYGFRYFIITNGHGGPSHVVALEEAARKVSKRYRCQAISITGGFAYRFLRGEFAEEIDARMPEPFPEDWKRDLKQDSHAGQWETAMMLKLKPNLVKPIYQNLPPVVVPLREKFRTNYAFRNGRQGYIGFPARATREFADASSEVLLAKALEIVERMLTGEDVQKLVTTPLWRIPFFRTYFWPLAGSILTLLLALLIGFLFL